MTYRATERAATATVASDRYRRESRTYLRSTARPTMSDALPAQSPVDMLATEAASDAVPLGVTGEPDFDAWRRVVDDVRDDVRYTLLAELP